MGGRSCGKGITTLGSKFLTREVSQLCDGCWLALKETYKLLLLLLEFLNPLLEGANVTFDIRCQSGCPHMTPCLQTSSPPRRGNGALVLDLGIHTLVSAEASPAARVAHGAGAVAANLAVATLSTGERPRLTRPAGCRTPGGSRRGSAAAAAACPWGPGGHGYRGGRIMKR